MTYQFKIELQDVSDPPVWRTVLVPDSFTFHHFHLAIQDAFGWGNAHMYEFSPKGFGSSPSIGIKESRGFGSEGDADKDASKVKLSKVFTKPGQIFIYIYDFGDSWEHKIMLEKIINDTSKIADCIDGKGTCPPEDCGGPWGYEDLKVTLADSKHPEHADMKEWLGLKKNQKWNADAFDLKKAAALVRKI
jgi:hypothetical protein